MFSSSKLALRLSSILVVAAAALALGGCSGTTAGARPRSASTASYGPTVMHFSPGLGGATQPMSNENERVSQLH